MSQIGECSTPSLSKRGCVPRGEMEDVSGGGAVRAKFLSNVGHREINSCLYTLSDRGATGVKVAHFST